MWIYIFFLVLLFLNLTLLLIICKLNSKTGMKKYFKRKSEFESSSSSKGISKDLKECPLEINLDDLPADPELRIRILDYHPNIRGQVRRAYLQKGPCQAKKHNFPSKKFGELSRRFNPSWFTEYANWLEYSIAKDAAFFLCCYLFKPNIGEQACGDSFVSEGFSDWKKKERFNIHVGGPLSAHNQAWRKCEVLLNQKQHIETILSKQSKHVRSEYRIHLNAFVDCVRFLLRQGIAFRGHDESENSSNQGNFLELLRFLADHNQDIKAVTLKNAP